MQARAMRREFSFQGLKFPDPDSKMTVEDVRGVLADAVSGDCDGGQSPDRKPSATR